MASEDLLIVAGEASGDAHAAYLLRALKTLVPGLRPFGLGGDELIAEGLEALAHSTEISVVGITEALRVLPKARQIFDRLLQAVDSKGATTAVLVDFPEFNLRLARALKERGLKVVYYISPQIWAWRQGRVRTVRQVVDKMLVILPFEAEFYRQHDVEAEFVGHPLLDELPDLPHVWDAEDGASREPFQITLMPGSRVSEIQRILPVLEQTAGQLSQRLPCRFSLVCAPTLRREQLTEMLGKDGPELEIVSQRRFETIAASHLAFCASGTATLEVGLLGTPMIVLYRVSAGTFLLARLLASSPYASLVNLLLERESVPEMIQKQATPRKLSRLAADLLTDPERIHAMRADLRDLRSKLGEPGASQRAAAAVRECLALD